MIQQLKFLPENNYYSCQICGNSFSTKKIYKIIAFESPRCSSKCDFRFYFKILSAYSNNQLLNLQNVLDIKDFCQIPKHSFIFRVTKMYMKGGLSSVK